MQLGDLFDDARLDLATATVEIHSVENDSRRCTPGSLFLAMPGTQDNGERYVDDAIERGAVAVMATSVVTDRVPVVVVPTSQVRALAADVSSSIVGHPERELELVGVTGTNGKTTVTTLVGEMAQILGWNGASVGTLTNLRTTPAPPELYRTLRRIVDGFTEAKPRAVVGLEVSSHALDQGRVDGLVFEVAAFTNLSHDHLDYHGTMEAYFGAKSALFSADRTKRAVIWVDDAYGARLRDAVRVPAVPVTRADAHAVTSSILGTSFFWRGHLVRSPLVGAYNVDNALVAMTVLSVLGAPDEEVAAALGDVHGVPGRFQVVRDADPTVIVDYAHTPAGLERLLRDVRELAPDRRVTVVFGCGGDRDQAKRPVMGSVAEEWSDRVVVTSDNPRSESPDAIIDAIMSGMAAAHAVHRDVDRRTAIEWALTTAAPGDVVVIAGKGHETTQTTGDRVEPFDDRVVVREWSGRC